MARLRGISSVAIILCVCNLVSLIVPAWNIEPGRNDGVFFSCRNGSCLNQGWMMFAILGIAGQIAASFVVVLGCSADKMQNTVCLERKMASSSLGSGVCILANSLFAYFLLNGDHEFSPGFAVYLSVMVGIGFLLLGFCMCYMVCKKDKHKNEMVYTGHFNSVAERVNIEHSNPVAVFED